MISEKGRNLSFRFVHLAKMPKFGIGDCVKFRGKEFELPSVEGLSVKLDTDKFIGKVTGSIDCGPKGTEYFVDVNVHGMTWNVKVSEDQIMSLKECVMDFVEGFAKTRKELSEKTAQALGRICEDLRKGPEIRFVNVPGYEGFVLHKGNVGFETKRESNDFKSFWPNAEDLIKKCEERYNVGVDAGATKPESKMTKQRCIKLLESYRAEREKVAKGRRFERCLRESVVNEALERAIELLKSEK